MKGKILLVDDDKSVRTVLTEVLGDEFQVNEAESGAALRRALEELQPDVVILDVNLTDGNGLELEMAESLAPHVHRLRQSMNHGAIDVEQAVAEHAVILDAVRGGDRDADAKAMADHISAVRSRALADG